MQCSVRYTAVKEGKMTYHVVVTATHLESHRVNEQLGKNETQRTNLPFRYSERMWICPNSNERVRSYNSVAMQIPCARPSHRERSKIRYAQSFSNVVACHCTRAFNEDISALASFP